MLWILGDWVNRLDAKLAEKYPSLDGLLGLAFSMAIGAAIIVPIALVVNFVIIPALE